MTDERQRGPMETWVLEQMPAHWHPMMMTFAREQDEIRAALVDALKAQHIFLCYLTEENTAARNDDELLVKMGDKIRDALKKAGVQ